MSRLLVGVAVASSILMVGCSADLEVDNSKQSQTESSKEGRIVSSATKRRADAAALEAKRMKARFGAAMPRTSSRSCPRISVWRRRIAVISSMSDRSDVRARMTELRTWCTIRIRGSLNFVGFNFTLGNIGLNKSGGSNENAGSNCGGAAAVGLLGVR